MDWMVATGSVCLGVLIGALVGWYVNEARKMSSEVLRASVAISTGGGILALFGFLTNGSFHEVWLYPIGLLLGFVVVTAVELYYYDYYGEPRRQKEIQTDAADTQEFEGRRNTSENPQGRWPQVAARGQTGER